MAEIYDRILQPTIRQFERDRVGKVPLIVWLMQLTPGERSKVMYSENFYGVDGKPEVRCGE